MTRLYLVEATNDNDRDASFTNVVRAASPKAAALAVGDKLMADGVVPDAATSYYVAVSRLTDGGGGPGVLDAKFTKAFTVGYRATRATVEERA